MLILNRKNQILGSNIYSSSSKKKSKFVPQLFFILALGGITVPLYQYTNPSYSLNRSNNNPNSEFNQLEIQINNGLFGAYDSHPNNFQINIENKQAQETMDLLKLVKMDMARFDNFGRYSQEALRFINSNINGGISSFAKGNMYTQIKEIKSLN
ncbi:MAG: hypothetical protein KC550_04800 [Nanoarchaeota archaeon]|nr:hypothetical protein [Nanoarchaeota archaeon]